MSSEEHDPAVVDPPAEQQRQLDDEMSLDDKAFAIISGDEGDEGEAPTEEEEGAPAVGEEEEPEKAEEGDESPRAEKISRLWARITRQDRELVELRRRLREKKGDDGGGVERIRQVAQENPRAALRELGLDIDSLLERMLVSPYDREEAAPQSPQQQTPKEIEELRQEIENLKRERQEHTQRQAMESEISKISALAESAPDRWELVRMNGDWHSILRSAASMYRQSGGQVVPDYETLLDTYEEHYEQEMKERAERWRGSKKTSRLLGLTPQQQAAVEQQAVARQRHSNGNASAAVGVPRYDEAAQDARALKLLEEMSIVGD